MGFCHVIGGGPVATLALENGNPDGEGEEDGPDAVEDIKKGKVKFWNLC